jgi:hypothetical protein
VVAIYEAPDDAVAARFTMQLGMLGNVRTRTMKAFPEDHRLARLADCGRARSMIDADIPATAHLAKGNEPALTFIPKDEPNAFDAFS